MAKQKIRFNYFEPQLVVEGNELIVWDMVRFLETILGNRRAFNAAVILGDEVSDLEWNSCGYDQANNLYYIQLSKLRSKNIPSRKRINQDKQDINLAEDEYLGEFNLLIYDPTLNVLITQGNFYGLTVKQIALSLSGLRMRTNEFLEIDEGEVPYVVNLAPIIDNRAIDNVLHNEIYRKVTIKGADFNEIAQENLNSTVLSRTIDALGEVNGVNFEVTLSMAKTGKEESLDSDEVRLMIADILRLNNDEEQNVAMHISSRRDAESAIESIDLLSPRLSSEIVLDVMNRSTIGHEFIFNGFKEQNYFNQGLAIQNRLGRLLVR